jgi:2-hydroxy-3-keto-5-methylthiopentenyl-1-phosphate phosphatase
MLIMETLGMNKGRKIIRKDNFKYFKVKEYKSAENNIKVFVISIGLKFFVIILFGTFINNYQ